MDSLFQNHAWHERNPKFEEDRKYLNLLQLHGLTQAWLKEIDPSEDTGAHRLHRLERTRKPVLAQNLWFLEKLRMDQLPPSLSSLLDGSSAQDFLKDLEENIWIIQFSVFENAMEHTLDRASLTNLLEKITWSHAKRLSEERWPDLKKPSPYECYQIFQYSPLQLGASSLLESNHPHFCSFFWLNSPLSNPSLNRSPLIREFCHIHFQFIQGFFYGMSRTLRTEIVPVQLKGIETYRVSLNDH